MKRIISPFFEFATSINVGIGPRTRPSSTSSTRRGGVCCSRKVATAAVVGWRASSNHTACLQATVVLQRALVIACQVWRCSWALRPKYPASITQKGGATGCTRCTLARRTSLEAQRNGKGLAALPALPPPSAHEGGADQIVIGTRAGGVEALPARRPVGCVASWPRCIAKTCRSCPSTCTKNHRQPRTCPQAYAGIAGRKQLRPCTMIGHAPHDIS